MKDKKYVRWSEREVSVLCRWFPEEGMGVRERLKRRSNAAIMSKATSLGLTTGKPRMRLTLAGTIQIAEEYSSEGNALSKKMGIPSSTIRTRAASMGIKAPNEWKNFTEQECEILLEEHSINELCKLLPRHTKNSIIRKRMNLGAQTRHCNAWTECEIEILKKYYPTEGANVIARLPNRTRNSIYKKAYNLKLIKCE